MLNQMADIAGVQSARNNYWPRKCFVFQQNPIECFSRAAAQPSTCVSNRYALT
ncbi:hypothetical protein A4U88_3531 [Serratia marcescens]|nr:hypothetical protein A4U88_3531 [Serratia marcescens]